MVNLQLSPTTTFIDVSWELDSSSGKVDEYYITYKGDNEAYCYSTQTTTVASACNSNAFRLSPCTGYDITVQPLDNRNEIGVPATALSYTLPGKERNEHIFSFYPLIRKYQIISSSTRGGQ